MDYFDTLYARHSCRAFIKDELIPKESLEKILMAAARSASSKNVQPWKVSVLQGKSLENFRQEYTAAFDSGEKSQRPFQTYPIPLPPEWDHLAHKLGEQVFKHKGIERDDTKKRTEHARQNFLFFNAPQVIYLTTRKDAEKGTFLDCGMLLGALMNGIVAEGFACCPMFTGITYGNIVEKHLKLPPELMPVCALAVGKEANVHVNKIRTLRKPLEEWFDVLE